MLICIDGSYYVGLTSDLAQRIHDHSVGKSTTYTKTTKPKLLVWFESHPIREAAATREKPTQRLDPMQKARIDPS